MTSGFLYLIFLAEFFKIEIVITTFQNSLSNSYSSMAGGTLFALDSADLNSLDSTKFTFLIGSSSATLSYTAGNPITTIVTTPSAATGNQELVIEYQGSPMTLTCPHNCQIDYDWSMTPEAIRIVNRSASPGDIISFVGNILFPSDPTFIVMGSRSISNTPSLNNIIFRIPQDSEAGYYILGLSIVDIGTYYKSTFFSTWSNNMILYDFRCTPLITSLNTNVGSPQGQIITIIGYGWLSTTNNVVIYAGLTPCSVVSIQLYTIHCKIPQDSYIDIGFYVLSTGIQLTVYAQNTQALYQIQNEYFANDFTLGGVPASQISTQIINDLNEELYQSSNFNNFNRNNYIHLIISAEYDAMIYEGFFKPPIDGNYRFYISGYYQMSLYLSTTANSTNKTLLTQIATAQYVTTYGTIKESAQISSFIALQKNSFYKIVLLKQTPNYYTNMWSAVEISASFAYPYPSTYVTFYQLAITYTAQQEIQQLAIYNWNSGTFQVVILGYNPPVTGTLVCDRVSGVFDRSITASDLSSGLNAIFDYPPTVVRVALDSNGNIQASDTGAAGFQWTITINNYRNNWNGIRYSPSVVILTYDTNPVATMIEIQPSIPVSGTFNLQYGSTIISNIPSSTDCNGLLNYLQQLHYYTQYFTCDYDGTIYENRTYYLKFSELPNAPTTFTIDDTNLTGGQSGTKPVGSISLFASADNNSFYSPIPGDMLYITSSQPQVYMEINGAPSKCPNTNCQYLINETITPILESFSQSGNGLTLTISNYASLTIALEDITITFGGINCPMNSLNLPSLTCTFTNIPISTSIPVVHIQRIGYLINDVSLKAATTSCLGGQIISSNLCYNCDASCLTCNTVGPNACTSCFGTYKLYNGVCFDCDASCLTCDGIGPTACISCSNFQVLINGSCYNCDSSCQTCNGITASDCQSCFSNEMYYEGSCVISCPIGTFLNISSNTCVTKTICLGNQIWYQNQCFDTCPNGTYFNVEGNSCESCNQNCYTCANASTFCTSCFSTLKLSDNSSFNSCPLGTFLTNNTCYQCNLILNEEILGLEEFCNNITKVNFTVADFNNPVMFILIFSAKWENLNLINLNESFSITINKLNKSNYTWTISQDYFSENEFYLTINYINSSFQIGDKEIMTVSLNSSKLETPNFILTNTQNDTPLLSLGSCLASNNEYYNSTTQTCQNFLLINPVLEYTKDPLKIQIVLNYKDEYLNKLISTLGKISFEKNQNTDFQNISISSDLFIIISINKTITGNPKLTLDLGSVPIYLDNTTIKLYETQFSINLMDYYNLAQTVKDAMNKASQTSNTGNILIFLGMIANIIIGSQAGLLLKGLMLNDLIHFTKFININYPPNIIYLYLSRTSMSSWIDLPTIDDSNNFDIPPVLRVYNISPYFLNNFGKELFQISLTYAIGLCSYLLFKNFVNKAVKRFMILKNLYYFFTWDYTLIYMVSNFTKILVFAFIKLRFSTRFQTISEKIDLISAILMLTFCLLLILHFYLKIYANFSCEKFSISPALSPTRSPETSKPTINFNSIFPSSDIRINSPPKQPKILSIRKASVRHSISIKTNILKIPETGTLDPNQKIPDSGTLDTHQELSPQAIFSFESLKTEQAKGIYAKTVNFIRRKIDELLKYIYVENLEERNNNILNMTKKETEIHKYYLIIELIRFILLTAFTILLYGFPLLQILLMFLFNLLFFLLTAFSNPFKERHVFIITIINEFLINNCFLICFILTIYDFNEFYIGLDEKMNLGWAFIVFDMFLLYFMFLFNGFRIVRGLLVKFHKKRNMVYPIQMQ